MGHPRTTVRRSGGIRVTARGAPSLQAADGARSEVVGLRNNVTFPRGDGRDASSLEFRVMTDVVCVCMIHLKIIAPSCV